MTDNTLTGAVALVTGATGGIGAATARRLAREGAAISVVAARRQRLDELADDITATGGAAFVIEADLTEPDRAAEAVQSTLDRFGRLDVLVNNAGTMLLATALHTTTEEWDRMVALNITALLHLTHAAVPYLIDAAATSPRGVADLVNVSSTAGRAPRPATSVYTLTMLGLSGFTEALRQELLVERVRVSLVEPCTSGTDLVDHPGAARDAVCQVLNGAEPLRPDDIADAIAYVVTRDRLVAINDVVVRSGDQTW